MPDEVRNVRYNIIHGGLGLLWLAPAIMQAGTNTYKINLNTAGLIGHPAAPFALAFQLSDGGFVGNGNTTVKIDGFDFGGGTPTGAPLTVGGVTGSVSTSITLIDSQFLSYFIQSFTPGSVLKFSITMISNSGDPDQMSFSILDSSGNEIPTKSPERFFQIFVSVSNSETTVQSFGSDPSRTPAAGGGQPITVPAACPYGLSRSIASVGAFGDLAGVTVSTGSNCPWTAMSAGGGISINPTTQIVGGGKVYYNISPNITNSPRTHVFSVDDQTFTAVQAASGCAFTTNLPNTMLGSAASTSALTVTTIPACAWTAVAYPSWITFPGAFVGTGNGSVPVSVAENTTTLPRTGVIVVGGQVLQITQQRATTPSLTAPFSDVPLSYDFANHITLLKQNAITSGCTATSYCPNDPVTRGQMAVFLIRGRLGLSAGQTFPFAHSDFFTDVPSTSAFYAFIQKMRELAITSGCTATSYCSEASTTRGQMAAFLIRTFFTP